MITRPSVSILMAVYFRDNPFYLDEAIESLSSAIHLIDKLILVEDGPLTEPLQRVIQNKKEKFKILNLKLANNNGLGMALNAGIKVCKSDFILRMDADDISLHNRLEEYLQVYNKNTKLDVIGSYIVEIDEFTKCEKYIREVPTSTDSIYSMIWFRSTINHVTAFIRTKAIKDVGGYEGGRGFAEDWWLWARMIKKKKQFLNIPKVLVKVRAGRNYFTRRCLITNIPNEIRLFWLFNKIKLAPKYKLVIALICRLTPMILGPQLTETLYCKILRVHKTEEYIKNIQKGKSS